MANRHTEYHLVTTQITYSGNLNLRATHTRLYHYYHYSCY